MEKNKDTTLEDQQNQEVQQNQEAQDNSLEQKTEKGGSIKKVTYVVLLISVLFFMAFSL